MTRSLPTGREARSTIEHIVWDKDQSARPAWRFDPFSPAAHQHQRGVTRLLVPHLDWADVLGQPPGQLVLIAAAQLAEPERLVHLRPSARMGSLEGPGSPEPSMSRSCEHGSTARIGLVIKNRGHFPNDDAAVKLLWLAIRDIEDKRARQRAKEKGLTANQRRAPSRLVEGAVTQGWKPALGALALTYPDRLGPYLK